MTGIDLCKHLSINRPSTPVLVMTAFGNMPAAIAVLRAGARDFVSKRWIWEISRIASAVPS